MPMLLVLAAPELVLLTLSTQKYALLVSSQQVVAA
jgi:hypothetical protein